MNFAVLDIETDISGIATDIGIFDGQTYLYFTDVAQAVKAMLNSSDIIYAHYGMRFDFAVIYKELLSQVNSMDIAMSGSSGVFITVKVGKKTKVLLDSYRLMPASLAKLSSQFALSVPKQQISVMPWELSTTDRQAYLKDDCLSLHELITKFWSVIDSSFGLDRKGKPFRSKTLASLSLKIFIDKYTKAGKIFNPPKEQAASEQESYFGGLVYVAAEHTFIRNIHCYDVNSMYPYIMYSSKFPYSYHRSKVSKYIKGRVGLWLCDYEHYGALPFVFDCISRSLSFTGRAVLDGDSIDYIRQIGGTVNIIEGHIYERVDFIFKDFIKDCYKLRQQYGNASPMGYIAKILMNSLYGKFGEKDVKRSLSTKMPPKDAFDVKIGSIGDNAYSNTEVYDFLSSRYIQHRFPAIASFVTLRSRLLLKKYADIQGENFVYCDTDCIHTLGEATGLDIGLELGQFKHEFTGDAYYKGKKAYQLFNADGSVFKTVLKGIPASAHSNIDFRELDKEHIFTYNSYTSLLDVARNDRAFRKKDLTRTVRTVDSRVQ